MAAAAGCSRSKDDSGPPVKATLLTSYGMRGRDAFAFVAREKGYLSSAGFDVAIEPGGDLAANLRRLQSGGPVFAALDLTACLLAAAGPAGPNDPGSSSTGPSSTGPSRTGPSGFSFLAGIHQRTTAAILAPGGGSIATPRDLGGKTLADLPGSTVRDLFPTYARLAGIDATRTAWVNATPQTMAGDLSRGRMAGVGDTVAGRRAVEAATHGRTAVVLAYSDQLQDLYGDALATSAAYAQAEPGKARKFAAALLRGLADAIDDPVAAGAIMHKYAPGVTAEAAAAELGLMAPYVRSAAEGIPVGALDANRVARSIAVLRGAGQIGPGLTPDQVMNPELLPGA
jgi:NitT/TauT family transport system substrate-binding protein